MEADDARRYTELNRRLWNELVPIHARSDFYALDAFRNGASSLKATELEQLGDVAGTSMLHLQCHFGMDTLSWARLGARVTGVDISDEAISLATRLSRDLDVPARFIRSDLYDLPDVLDEEFDIVFSSYGALYWLPHLDRWARIVMRFLRRGGAFHLVEFHPFTHVFHDTIDAQVALPESPYFQEDEPLRWQLDGSYADRSAVVENASYEWGHAVGEVVTALLDVGLRIERLREYPYSSYPIVPSMEEDADGRWRLTGPNRGRVPLMFSVKATKDS